MHRKAGTSRVVSSTGSRARGTELQAKRTSGAKQYAAKKGKPRHPACRDEDQSADDIGPAGNNEKGRESGGVRAREKVEST
jgi:hypothetical protein